MTEAAEEETNQASQSAESGMCIGVVCPDAAVDAGCFAAGLAWRLAGKKSLDRHGQNFHPVVLVDGLPGTGGLDVIADLERAPGARWTALRGVSGALDVDRLVRALPHRDGVSVLSHDRSRDVVDPDVRSRTLRALADPAEWVVVTQPPDALPDEAIGAIVLLLRGSVPGLVAGQRYVEQLAGELPVAVVLLEMPSATRTVVTDSLGHPLVAAAPTRWKLAHAVGSEVAAGMWPGSRDRVMGKLVEDVAIYVRSRGRSAAWA